MGGLITWKFVDQPIASPTVLLDMNNGTTARIQGLQMPAPPLRRSIASNAMSDGGIVSSAAYDLRELKFTAFLNGPTLTDKIAQLDALKAQLAKPSNLLMFAPPGGTNPVFFHTVRSDDYLPDYQGAARAEWYIQCTILAQPFAIGIRRDFSQVTVTNDPAAGTNPTRWDMTGIVGDSPSPAFVRLQGLGAGGTAILSQRTQNNPTTLTLFNQAETATLGTDTVTWTSSAMSNGTGTSTFFGTNAGLATRVTVTLPTGSDPAALRGRYRVYARVEAAGTASTFTVRYLQNPAAGQDGINGPQVSFAAPTAWSLLDLGVIDFPAFQSPPALGYSGLSPGFATNTFAVQVARGSGSSTFDIDYVYLVPADERMCVVRQTAAVGYIVVDGPNDATYGMAAGSSPFSGTLSSRVVDNAGGLVSRMGGAPLLVPGVTNRWHLLVDKANVTATATVDVSYWPRWREVATS